jgi:hypothetical protein
MVCALLCSIEYTAQSNCPGYDPFELGQRTNARSLNTPVIYFPERNTTCRLIYRSFVLREEFPVCNVMRKCISYTANGLTLQQCFRTMLRHPSLGLIPCSLTPYCRWGRNQETWTPWKAPPSYVRTCAISPMLQRPECRQHIEFRTVIMFELYQTGHHLCLVMKVSPEWWAISFFGPS